MQSEIAGVVAKYVGRELPKEEPNYTDKDAKLLLLRIGGAVKEKFPEIQHGISQSASGNMDSPFEDGKRSGNVKSDTGELPNSHDASHVGRFDDAGYNPIAVCNINDGLRLQADGKEDRYEHKLQPGEKVYDGKHWQNNVLQLNLQNGEQFQIALLLTEKQHEVAEKALEIIASFGSKQLNGEIDQLEKIEKKLAEANEAHEATKQELQEANEAHEAHEATKTEVEEANKGEKSSEGGYGFYSGLTLGLVLVAGGAYAYQRGYVKVPEGVRMWLMNTQEQGNIAVTTSV